MREFFCSKGAFREFAFFPFKIYPILNKPIIIEPYNIGGSNENSLTTEKSVFTNVENEPEELAVAATLPDRNNILQNNLSRPKGDPTSSTTTSRPTTPSLPPSGRKLLSVYREK